jgi:hypothetical protein
MSERGRVPKARAAAGGRDHARAARTQRRATRRAPVGRRSPHRPVRAARPSSIWTDHVKLNESPGLAAARASHSQRAATAARPQHVLPAESLLSYIDQPRCRDPMPRRDPLGRAAGRDLHVPMIPAHFLPHFSSNSSNANSAASAVGAV